MAGHAGGFSEAPGGLTNTVTRFQDNQAQTNFWAAFLAEANTINNQLTAIQNGTEQASQALITQIQNYQHFGAAFDAAQGAIFQARFDNELLSGTLLADSTNAIAGLTGILNGDTGAKLAADMAQINAAGKGFVADALDVDGNNIPLGGGHDVGTATTVAGATTVHGLAMGTIAVTANPNIANGTGGTATAATTMSGTTSAGGAPHTMAPPATTPVGGGTTSKAPAPTTGTSSTSTTSTSDHHHHDHHDAGPMSGTTSAGGAPHTMAPPATTPVGGGTTSKAPAPTTGTSSTSTSSTSDHHHDHHDAGPPAGQDIVHGVAPHELMAMIHMH
jgi:hypothetical protein